MEDGTSKSAAHCEVTDPYDAFQWDAREDCEVRQILDRIADKWSLLAIALLEGRTLRFTELQRKIDGISQRMLTVTLRQLERDGLVTRTVYPVVPPRVEYELSPLGIDAARDDPVARELDRGAPGGDRRRARVLRPPRGGLTSRARRAPSARSRTCRTTAACRASCARSAAASAR